MNENQEIKPTSKSHLKALVKKGREKAQKEAEADERDRAERAVRRRQRQGSNYDPSENDLEDSYDPQGNFVSEEDMGEKIRKGVERARAKRETRKLVQGTPIVKGNKVVGQKGGVKNPNIEVQTDSYDPTAEFADRVMREAFDKMTKGELKDYDSKSNKPGSQLGHRRDATQAEREEMAKKFRAKRRGPGPGRKSVKQQRRNDLRNP